MVSNGWSWDLSIIINDCYDYDSDSPLLLIVIRNHYQYYHLLFMIIAIGYTYYSLSISLSVSILCEDNQDKNGFVWKWGTPKATHFYYQG